MQPALARAGPLALTVAKTSSYTGFSEKLALAAMVLRMQLLRRMTGIQAVTGLIQSKNYFVVEIMVMKTFRQPIDTQIRAALATPRFACIAPRSSSNSK